MRLGIPPLLRRQKDASGEETEAMEITDIANNMETNSKADLTDVKWSNMKYSEI